MKLVDIGDNVYVNPEHVSSVLEVTSLTSGSSYIMLSMISGDEVRAPAWSTLAAVIEVLRGGEE